PTPEPTRTPLPVITPTPTPTPVPTPSITLPDGLPFPPSWNSWPGAMASGSLSANQKDSIRLATGWNLISVATDLVDPAVSGVFAGYEEVDEVWAYSAAGKSWSHASRVTSGWTGDAVRIVPGAAYWVHASAATEVGMTYASRNLNVPPPVYELGAGWNLIGYPSLSFTDKMDLEAYLFSLKGWTVMLRHDPESGMAYATPASGFTYVELGRGYYIYLEEPGLLVP
ncbi:hypothetical protein ACFLTS_03600, partial [Chloroflexota bacterium]